MSNVFTVRFILSLDLYWYNRKAREINKINCISNTFEAWYCHIMAGYTNRGMNPKQIRSKTSNIL
jgi:hypothetical protein